MAWEARTDRGVDITRERYQPCGWRQDKRDAVDGAPAYFAAAARICSTMSAIPLFWNDWTSQFGTFPPAS